VLAHELRRRVAALRVAGEAIITLRGQGVDTAGMLELLVDEIEDLDELAREVLREGRAERGTDAAAAGLPTASGVRAGHGIGLFLVRRFLDAAGGRSWLTERQGGGTVVGLSLPLRHGQAGGERLEDAVNA
jgi:signal transduction histidine kinase